MAKYSLYFAVFEKFLNKNLEDIHLLFSVITLANYSIT